MTADSKLGSVSGAEPTLRALMLRGLDGDAPAYARLLTQLADHLRVYFRRRLPAPASDLEDLVQETLLAIHAKRHTYERDRLLTPWVFAIARFKLLGHYRGSARRAAASLDAALEVRDPRNPDEGAIRHDVRRLLALLPGRQRRLLAGTKLSGLSVAEAASLEGMSEGAVKVSVHRSLKVLAEKVRDED